MNYTYYTLQRKFRDILMNHGQNVYLRRRCAECSQGGINAKYDDDCEICGGTGYHQKLEGYTMRKMIVGTQFSFPSAMGREAFGIVLDEGSYFFCDVNVSPKYGDLIYDLNNSTQQWEAYEINKVLERRFDDRVLFYNCACEIKEGSDT